MRDILFLCKRVESLTDNEFWKLIHSQTLHYIQTSLFQCLVDELDSTSLQRVLNSHGRLNQSIDTIEACREKEEQQSIKISDSSTSSPIRCIDTLSPGALSIVSSFLSLHEYHQLQATSRSMFTGTTKCTRPLHDLSSSAFFALAARGSSRLSRQKQLLFRSIIIQPLKDNYNFDLDQHWFQLNLLRVARSITICLTYPKSMDLTVNGLLQCGGLAAKHIKIHHTYDKGMPRATALHEPNLDGVFKFDNGTRMCLTARQWMMWSDSKRSERAE